MQVRIEDKVGEDLQILHLALEPDEVLTPDSLKGLKVEGIDTRKGVIINGKSPIWMYGYWVHECHPAAWVAVNDSRLGAIVVATHSPNRKVGECINWQ